jgi:hypothetical protein
VVNVASSLRLCPYSVPVAERRALIVGSECTAMNQLGFPSELAAQLADRLYQYGHWRPVSPDQPCLLNPDASEFKAAVRHAFALANAESAQLLFAFVGHGVSTGGADYYLQACNSPAVPNSDTALSFGEVLREELKAATSLDGLLVLVDACEASEAVQSAASRLVNVVGSAGGRMELLVASGVGAAYGGCFTRSVLTYLESGLVQGRENILVADLVEPLREACPKQNPECLTFNGGGPGAVGVEDVGLWLTPNVARARHCLTGRPAAGLLDQVTRQVRSSDAQRSAIAELLDNGGKRLRGLQGPAGAGKTTVMAFLVRPTQKDAPGVAEGLIKAAAFLDASSTPESVAIELAAQLTDTVAGFAQARAEAAAQAEAAGDASLDAVERELRRPLARVGGPGVRVHLLIDGLDQVEGNQAQAICGAIARLSAQDDPDLAHLRLIVGARSSFNLAERSGLQNAAVVGLPPPTWAELSPETVSEPGREVDGGWLALRLDPNLHPGDPINLGDVARNYYQAALDRSLDPDGMRAVVALLAAAGTGPILPFAVLHRAMQELDLPREANRIRDILVELGSLVQRGNAGLDTEQVGLSHTEILRALTEDLA